MLLPYCCQEQLTNFVAKEGKATSSFYFFQGHINYLPKRRRSISCVPPADLWLKNFMSESPRSYVIFRRAANFLFAATSFTSQYNMRNAECIASSLDWSLRSMSLWNTETLLIISASTAYLCCELPCSKTALCLNHTEASMLNLLDLFCKLTLLCFLHIR